MDEFKKENLKKLQDWAKKRGFFVGEVLLLINRAFGYSWETIPDDKFNDVTKFINVVWNYRYKIIEPEFYRKCRDPQVIDLTLGYSHGCYDDISSEELRYYTWNNKGEKTEVSTGRVVNPIIMPNPKPDYHKNLRGLMNGKVHIS